MTGVAIQIFGVPETFRVLDGIARRARNAKAFWSSVGAQVKEQTFDRFEQQRGPDGTAWPQSLRVKMLQGGGLTLVKSGLLRRSLTVEADNDGAVVFTVMKYAAIHQFGGTIHRPAHDRVLNFRVEKDGKIKPGFRKKRYANFQMKAKVDSSETTMPARPFMGINEENARDILQKAARYLIDVDGVATQ